MRPDEPGRGIRQPWAALLLAAGRSSRMGTPKTLLPLAGEAMVRRATRTLMSAGFDHVWVVVRPEALEVDKALCGLPVTLVENVNADSGIGSSIAAGVSAIGADVEWLMLTLADQPLVVPSSVSEVRARAMASPCSVVASRYAGTVGPPAAFARRLFPRLKQLTGDRGCKAIILESLEQSVFVDCPEAAFDVDTPADYDRLGRRRLTEHPSSR